MSQAEGRPGTAPLARVAGLLEFEHEGARMSVLQQLWFVLLQLFVYLLPPLIAALLLVDRLPREYRVALPYLQVAVTVCFVALVPTILLNAPLIARALRQARLTRKLKSLRLAEMLSGSDQGDTISWFRTVAILITPAALLGLFIANLVRRSGTTGLDATLFEIAVVLSVCIVLPVSLYCFDLLLERLRARLGYAREVTSLRQALRREDGEVTPSDLPRELALRMSAVERVHILRERARALERSDEGREEGLLIAKAPAVVETLRRLELDARLEVEEAIEHLSTDPTPADSLAGTSENRWSLSVPTTNLRIIYSLDRPSGRIDVLAVEETTGRLPSS